MASTITDFVFAMAGSGWVYVLLAVLLIVDGFFPLVPGETTVVALATLGVTGHGPDVWLVFAVAVVATMAGDAIAFILGRTVRTDRWKWMRGAKVARIVSGASRAVVKRPTVTLIAAKFVPIGRVLVTMAAGAGGLSPARYIWSAFAAATVYTGYHVLIASAAGSVFASNPLLGLAVSIGILVGISLLVKAVHRVMASRRGRITAGPLP